MTLLKLEILGEILFRKEIDIRNDLQSLKDVFEDRAGQRK